VKVNVSGSMDVALQEIAQCRAILFREWQNAVHRGSLSWCTWGAHASGIENSKKYYFKVSENFEIIFFYILC
jgi:hypothetical protein